MSKIRNSNSRVELVLTNRTRQPLPLAFFRRVAAETLRALRVRDASVGIAFVGISAMRAAARRRRGARAATNVLAFRYERRPLIGDILLCAPVVFREARAFRRSARAHCARLIVHGIVHLAGHTHDTKVKSAAMERIEKKISSRLGLR